MTDKIDDTAIRMTEAVLVFTTVAGFGALLWGLVFLVGAIRSLPA